MKNVRAIMIGDVVGDPGLEALEGLLPSLIRESGVDLAVVNGENAAGGFGMTEACLRRILAAGADVVTSGNHVWEKREFLPVLGAEERILRPANYPPGAPGRGWVRINKADAAGEFSIPWLVVNLQGREYMTAIDCPFKAFDAIFDGQEKGAWELHSLLNPQGQIPGALSGGGALVVVDFHAESPREKEALAYYLDGRASVVAGTHTHVQTADERLLPQGTAYITDLGMTGAAGGVIGMDPKICLDRARHQVLYRMDCAKPGPEGGTIQGVLVEIDPKTGKALSIERISRGGSQGA